MRLTLHLLSLAIALFAAHGLMRGAPPAPLDDLPIAVPGILALAVLGLGILGFAKGRARPTAPESVARRAPGWADRAAIAGPIIALHFGFLWLLGTAPPVVERIGIAAEPWLRPEHAAARQDPEAATSEARGQGNWLWQDRRVRALPNRTDLRPGNRPDVFLRFDSPDQAARVVARPAYLTAFTLAKYEGPWWTTPATSPTPVESTGDGVSRFPVPPARAAIGPIRHEVFHGSNTSGQNMLITLQGPESATIAPLEQYDDGFVVLPQPPDTGIGYQYRATSRPLVLTDLPDDASLAMPDDIPPTLLELPQSPRIATHLAGQARAIVGESPTPRTLAALESWLQGAYDYSLQTTNPLDLDPLENFLFAERRGHCEHFAMTGALMLRALGLPSRVAYGWAGGTWYASPGLMVFRSREAHAWAELWVPDYGWIVIDPTPPSSNRSSSARVAPRDETAPDPATLHHASGDTAGTTRIDHTAAWLLGIFGLPALFVLAWRNRGRLDIPGSAPISPGGLPYATGYHHAWIAACPPLHPGETLRQQIRRLDARRPRFSARLIAYHYGIHYHHGHREPAVERDLERRIRQWHRQRKTRKSLE